MQLSIYLGVYATIYVSMCEDPSREYRCILYMYASWYVGVYATIYISRCVCNYLCIYVRGSIAAQHPVLLCVAATHAVCCSFVYSCALCCTVLQQCLLFVAVSLSQI